MTSSMCSRAVPTQSGETITSLIIVAGWQQKLKIGTQWMALLVFKSHQADGRIEILAPLQNPQHNCG